MHVADSSRTSVSSQPAVDQPIGPAVMLRLYHVQFRSEPAQSVALRHVGWLWLVDIEIS